MRTTRMVVLVVCWSLAWGCASTPTVPVAEPIAEPIAAPAFPVAPELFLDEPFAACEGISFNHEGRLFVACNRKVWEIAPDRSVREVVEVYTNLGLAPVGERDLLMADFGPTNVFREREQAVNDGIVWRITPEGEKTTVATGIEDPNFVLLRADGSFLVSDDGTDKIYLVDTEGEVSIFSQAVPFPNGLAFSLDDRTLYVAQIFRTLHPTVGDNRVWAIDLDTDGRPASAPRLLATLTEDGFNDGLAVDRLGRVYVAENAGGRIWRLDPASGEQVLIAEGMPHIASLAFGHGAFGATALYGTSTFRGGGKVWKVEVGVRGAPLHR